MLYRLHNSKSGGQKLVAVMTTVGPPRRHQKMLVTHRSSQQPPQALTLTKSAPLRRPPVSEDVRSPYHTHKQGISTSMSMGKRIVGACVEKAAAPVAGTLLDESEAEIRAVGAYWRWRLPGNFSTPDDPRLRRPSDLPQSASAKSGSRLVRTPRRPPPPWKRLQVR